MTQHSAIILAAGRGSRMGETTAESHKCLTLLDNQPLLHWQIYALKQAGIQHITLVAGYRAEMLEGDFKKIINTRWAQTNMVSSLFCVADITQDTIVSYSDIVYTSQHIEDLIDKEGDLVITADRDWFALWNARMDNPLEDAETFITEGDILKEIGTKNDALHNIDAQYMGLLKFSPKGWNKAKAVYNSFSCEQQDKLDMTSFLNILCKNMTVNVVFVQGRWCEVDTNEDVEVYEKALNQTEKWSHDWR